MILKRGIFIIPKIVFFFGGVFYKRLKFKIVKITVFRYYFLINVNNQLFGLSIIFENSKRDSS